MRSSCGVISRAESRSSRRNGLGITPRMAQNGMPREVGIHRVVESTSRYERQGSRLRQGTRDGDRTGSALTEEVSLGGGPGGDDGRPARAGEDRQEGDDQQGQRTLTC
jgi:hypothetical protein